MKHSKLVALTLAFFAFVSFQVFADDLFDLDGGAAGPEDPAAAEAPAEDGEAAAEAAPSDAPKNNIFGILSQWQGFQSQLCGRLAHLVADLNSVPTFRVCVACLKNSLFPDRIYWLFSSCAEQIITSLIITTNQYQLSCIRS